MRLGIYLYRHKDLFHHGQIFVKRCRLSSIVPIRQQVPSLNDFVLDSLHRPEGVSCITQIFAA
jgi:hypothetical protein